MSVFKTYFLIVKKYMGTIMLYTIMLIVFGGINMTADNQSLDFTDSKPDVFIVNRDQDIGITHRLIEYIEDNSHIVDIKDTEMSIDDAVFYRDVNYVIYIPYNYREDILNGGNPSIDIKSTGDYQASLANMQLERYLKVQNIYRTRVDDEEELIRYIDDNFNKRASVQVVNKIDINKISNVCRYFNFASYSIMAVIIFVVCLVLSSFRNRDVNKRIIIGGIPYTKCNRYLLVASFVYMLVVWILFIILGISVLGSIMFTVRGIIYIINSLLFAFCSLTIALLISGLVSNKNAVSGIVNVVALGSAFLCGAFVPQSFLPNFVLNIAHLLPAYWYIHSNDLLVNISDFSIASLQSIFINFVVLIIFSVIFIVVNDIVSRRKRRVG